MIAKSENYPAFATLTGVPGAVAQSGSAPRSHRGGQGFKSPQLHILTSQDIGMTPEPSSGAGVLVSGMCPARGVRAGHRLHKMAHRPSHDAANYDRLGER